MCHSMRDEARIIIDRAIQAVLPDEAVFRALKSRPLTGRVLLVAAGKAAWQMANAAHEYLGEQIEAGVVVGRCQLSIIQLLQDSVE